MHQILDCIFKLFQLSFLVHTYNEIGAVSHCWYFGTGELMFQPGHVSGFFLGPFCVCILFFIERDELDIYDIPIAKITADFLAYIREMEALNLDLASEFILVAATLIRIKAKMLLPRKELDENNEEIDPRKELVQKLLEYKAVKEA